MSEYLVEEAVVDADDDMSRVQIAADAIVAAIKAARPWITDQTWSGPAARSWCREWNGLYNQLLGLLGELPSARAVIVSRVRAQAETQVASEARAAARPYS